MTGKLRHSDTAKMVAAFSAVYLIWGSTYLAIRYAIDTIPWMFMGGFRFLVAGSAMYLWGRSHGAERPTRVHWRSTAIVGILLFVGGNGAVMWSEQFVPSGLAAILLSTTPLWMVMLDAVWTGQHKITKSVIGGILLGIAGIMMLITPGEILGQGHVDVFGAIALILGSLSWTIGSLYSRTAVMPKSLILISGMEMLAGGGVLMIMSMMTGELSGLSPATISWQSSISVAYLILFGSIVGFTAYAWLLKHTTPARLSTYAYVNPVVAVVLGWAIGGEELTTRTIIAAGIIIAAVVLIINRKSLWSTRTMKSVPDYSEKEAGNLSAQPESCQQR